MSQEDISINLKMVSVPALPTRDFRDYFPPAARTRAQARAFNFGRFFTQLLILAVVACLSFGCYLAVSRYIVQTIEVVGESMIPTLQPGHHYILNRWAYHDAEPARGDIVVIRDPGDHGISVKRVIALSGEAVHFVNGKVIVNGHTLNEPYLKPGTYTFTYAQAHEEFITCGKDQYFLLGDNRPVSIDSRAYGPVPREDILGRVSMDK